MLPRPSFHEDTLELNMYLEHIIDNVDLFIYVYCNK
jgi:hypothetical protein